MSVKVRVGGGRELDMFVRQLKKRFADTPTVLVGVPKGSGSYEDGTTIATVAAVNEFGSADGRIPERPALRMGVENAVPEIKRLYYKMMPEVARGERTSRNVQDMVGFLAVGKIQELISEGVSPENAPSTIAKKGSSKPLIDTGNYRQSITHVLSEPGEDIEEGL